MSTNSPFGASTIDRRTMLKSVAAAALFAGTPILGGCSTATTGSSESDGTIELWARGGTTGGDAWKKFIPQLQTDTGLTIKFSQVQNFDTELQGRAQSKNLPDVFVNDDVLMGTYQRQGLVLEINKAEYADAGQISDSLWKTATMPDGKVYGIPYSRQTMVTMIRSDWLAKLSLTEPKTWDDLVKVLDAFATMDPDGDGTANTYGINVAGAAKSGYMARWAMSYIWQGGGSFWTQGADGKFLIDTTGADTVAAVKWLQTLFAKTGRVQPGALTADTNASTPFFSEGKCGVTLTGPYNFPLHDKTPGKDKYVVVAAPAGPGGKRTVLAEGENVYLSAGTKKTADAKKVISWLISAGGQKAAMTNGVQPIVRVSVRGDLKAADVYADPRWGIVQDALVNSSAAFPAQSDASAIKQEVANSLNKIMASPTADPTPELGNLKGTLTKIFKDLGLA